MTEAGPTTEPGGRSAPIRPTPTVGVRFCGTGRAVPERVLTNHDLAEIMETSHEWIVQRTGICQRHVSDPSKGENTMRLCATALERALADARLDPSELDLVIVGTVTGEMTCPATACRVAAEVGASDAAAFDVLAACCGFLYGLNIAHDMIRAGSHRTIGVVGCDVMSRVLDYENRAVSVLFGDAAGAAIVRATDDLSRGMIAGRMHADGSRWRDLYLPQGPMEIPANGDAAIVRSMALQMNGREVYKFAVGTFSQLIEDTLADAGATIEDVDLFVCHQSNARMLESARARFGIPEEKMYINIDRYGNCSAGSVPVAFDELREAGRIGEDALVMFVAFGGGLTWSSSLWRV